MRGYNKWSYKPYVPLDRMSDKDNPYISRIAPYETHIEVEYINTDENSTITVFDEQDKEIKKLNLNVNPIVIDGLETEKEYKIVLENSFGKKSAVRKVKTGFVPGTVINYLDPKDDIYSFSGRFLCSPSLLRLPSGALLATNDIFGHAAPQNLTIIYRSDDNGETWKYVSEVLPCFWGKTFLHKGKLYMIGMSTEYGDVLIGCSEDEGYTWSEPTVIFRGSSDTSQKGPHRAPCVITESHGRLWTSVEYGAWERGQFSSGVLSIDVNDDLMVAENWTCTEFLPYNKEWDDAPDTIGVIEGNVVELPNGDLVNILRTNVTQKMLVLKIDANNPEKKEEFAGFYDFEHGHSKFEIKKGDDGYYYSVGNSRPLRNILSIYRSKDCIKWEFVKDVLNYSHLDKDFVGFQYPSYIFEGDELLILSRTAFNGASSFHDNNYITFHRVKYKL